MYSPPPGPPGVPPPQQGGYGPQGYPGYLPPQAFAPLPVNPAMGSANLAIGLGVASLPLCCAPLGILGGVFGLRAMSIAKKNGVETPARAIVAIVLAGLSILASLGMGVAMWMDSKERAERTAAVDEATKGKLEGPSITPVVACALTEKALLGGVYNDNTIARDVSCKGAYTGDAKQAQLTGVTAKISSDQKSLTTCFAKGSRWFVSAIVDAGAACPTDLPPVPMTKGSGEQMDAAETEFRKTLAAQEEKRAGDRFVASLDKVRDAVKNAPRAEKKCPAFDPKIAANAGTDAKIKIHSVDFDFLADPSKRDDGAKWIFLDDSEIRTGARPSSSSSDRSKAIKTIAADGGPYLLVWQSDERTWPTVMKKKKFGTELGYIGGELDGWLYVVDTRNASIVCSAGIDVRNSKSVYVSGRGTTTEDQLMRQLETDLKTNLHSNAATAIDKMTDGKMKLASYSF